MPPEVINLLLFLHTCDRLRIVTAHGLTQPVHIVRGVRQGNTESPLLYALLLEPLLSAQRKMSLNYALGLFMYSCKLVL